MNQTQQYRDLYRVKKVILSCRTMEQLNVARAMFYQLLKRCEPNSWQVQREFIEILNEQEKRIKDWAWHVMRPSKGAA